MQKTNKKLEEKIINSYINNEGGVKVIGDKYNINPITVYNILKRNNVSIRTKGGYDKNYFDKEKIINEYSSGVKVTDIAKEYNVPIETIYYILKTSNIPRDHIYINANLRRDYFHEIDSYDKAYFLGLMITDGCVLEDNSVSITLKESDSDILEVFRDKIGNENPLYINDRRRHNSYEREAIFKFKSKQTQVDLARYGVVYRKTFITFFPFLLGHPDMMRHMIRGLIDGDGWVSYKSHSMGICSASYEFIFWFREFMCSVLDIIKPTIIVQHETLFTVVWHSKHDIYAIGKFIYVGKKDCFLKRKFQNWLQIIIHDNTEVT